MSLKRWLALLLFYISYLFFGASIYYLIENKEEAKLRKKELNERQTINAYLTENLKGDLNKKIEVLVNITNFCGKKVTPYETDELEDPYKWNFYHAFFFAFTVCSTVGYGNLSPSTTLGRMILIGYSLIGVPVNTILFAGLGEYFGRLFKDIYRRYKNYKMSNDVLYIPRQFGLIATITMALIPGIFFFIILPACIFSYFEGWPFSLSIYYAYVTTTTIGFGDYVPTFQPHQERYYGVWFIVYQIFIMFWFIFSLGYLLMIMGFITNGLRSQKLRNLERQLKSNLKHTHQRIWHGVVKDVGYLRKLINEVYINVKPIYNETGQAPYDTFKSSSCPDLLIYQTTSPVMGRKRAFSECYNKLMKENPSLVGHGTPINRAFSDSDLDKINKEKTFETVNAVRETTNLLAKVVSALGNIHSTQYDSVTSINSSINKGYHGFSDSQILSDESAPNVTARRLFNQHRERASSDFFVNPKTIPALQKQNEWTWCGDNEQIQQEINNRVKFYKNNNLGKNALYKTALNNSVILNVESSDGEAELFKKRKSQNALLDLFRRRSSVFDVTKNRRKESIGIANSDKTTRFDNKYYTTKYSNIKIPYNSQMKSENNSTLFKLNNKPSDISTPQYSRKSSLKPCFSNNTLPDRKDSYNLAKIYSQRNSQFIRQTRTGSLAIPREANRLRTSSLNQESRRSIDSFCFDKTSENVLENTSIADLIRALELLHTRIYQSDHPSTIEEVDEEIKIKKQRKKGTSTPPALPPLLSLFSSNIDQSQLQVNDRFNDHRRQQSATTSKKSLPSLRRSSLKLELGELNKKDIQTKDINKCSGRRFSVRPVESHTLSGKSQNFPPNRPFISTTLQRKLSLKHVKDYKKSIIPPKTSERE